MITVMKMNETEFKLNQAKIKSNGTFKEAGNIGKGETKSSQQEKKLLRYLDFEEG
jgi:hypothetical protein